MEKIETRHIIRILMMVISFSAFLSPLSSCVKEDEPASTSMIGKALPYFSVTLNSGITINPESLLGKKVLIEFFNTSCGDCRRSFPVIEEVWHHFSDESDIFVFGIARDESGQEISDFWETNNLTFPYSPQEGREVYEKFAKSGIPRIYLINEEGIIFAEYGPDDTVTAEKLITELTK